MCFCVCPTVCIFTLTVSNSDEEKRRMLDMLLLDAENASEPSNAGNQIALFKIKVILVA